MFEKSWQSYEDPIVGGSGVDKENTTPLVLKTKKKKERSEELQASYLISMSSKTVEQIILETMPKDMENKDVWWQPTWLH